MQDYLRRALSGMDREDITQERFIADSTAWHGKRATVNIQNYQIERLWKQNYILVNVIAEGYDQKRFLEQMVKAKSKFAKISSYEMFIDTQPNVDYFTREELKALVKQFKDDVNKGKLNDVSTQKT